MKKIDNEFRGLKRVTTRIPEITLGEEGTNRCFFALEPCERGGALGISNRVRVDYH